MKSYDGFALKVYSDTKFLDWSIVVEIIAVSGMWNGHPLVI